MTLTSCNKPLEVNEYVSQLNKQFTQEKQVGEYAVHCQYKPAELLALDEMRTRLSQGEKITAATFETEAAKFNNALYFELNIGLKSKESIIKQKSSSQEEYTALLSELTYNMARDCYLIVDSKDTVRATTYNYSNTYAMAPDVQLLFAFPKITTTSSNKQLTLVYDDQVLGIGEKAMFEYQLADINQKMPALKLN